MIAPRAPSVGFLDDLSTREAALLMDRFSEMWREFTDDQRAEIEVKIRPLLYKRFQNYVPKQRRISDAAFAAAEIAEENS